MSTADAALDTERLRVWFALHIPQATLPLEFALITGGRSNLTFLVTDATGYRFVLRRPPSGHLLPGAHDMAREHRIISSLQPAGIPVPVALGYCDDLEVIGAPFYVMEHVDGIIIQSDVAARLHLDEPSRHRSGMSLIDTLVRIHSLDPHLVGLGDLGRKNGYIRRQLRRWQDNYEAANHARGGSPLPDIAAVYDRLQALVPEQISTCLVHGDYRLDNCVLAPDGSHIEAVLDWELCTLGDPIADLGQLLVYWPEPKESSPIVGSPTSLPGFATRAELVARYAERSGRDLHNLDYYVAFSYWKLACVLEGVHSRYVNGAMGADNFDYSFYPDAIAWFASRSRSVLEGLVSAT